MPSDSERTPAEWTEGTAPPADLRGVTACLIVDSANIARWEFEAVERCLARGMTVGAVLICDNTMIPRSPLRHAAYYALHFASLRQPATERVPWGPLVDEGTPIHRFEALWEGRWQRFPAAVRERLAPYGLDVALRFGMYLVRDPDDLGLPWGMLSFHHGDPAEYRGRPAGFYELLHGTTQVGAIVQRLSNKLDGGTILAFGVAPVVPHSYRRTLERTYEMSTDLLAESLLNAKHGRMVDRSTDGKNYRLPENSTVCRLVATLFVRRMRSWIASLRRKR